MSKMIFITTDTSNLCSEAVISCEKTWNHAQPVVFESQTFKGLGLNYLVYEEELLAIVQALKKWQSELFGS